ncbi:MAG TPA: PAS domain-containing protein, partial [Bacteroidia bacterium]|nr:PAS domain-containing protein [Bacteroidia bacterium]
MNNKKEQVINFKALFEAVPGLFLILKPNSPHFTILGASNAYLYATMTEREKIIGHDLFEVFPDNPDDHTATGTSNLRKSLESVLKNKVAHKMNLQKYDIQRPESEGGGFEERYWSPFNSPVLNENNEIEYIIHRVEDVSEFVLLEQKAAKEIKIAKTESDNKSLFIKSSQERVNTILNVLLKYTKLDFSEKIPVSETGDDLDAIAIGLNTLSEELISSREAEEQQIQNIKKVNDFLDTILENIPNMVFVKDANELRFVRFNKAGEKLLGYPRQDLIGKNDYDFFPKEQADFFTSKDRDALNKNDVTFIPEEIINTANGEKWLYTKKIPILDGNEKPLYLLGISEDITEKKISEEKVKELNRQLQDNVLQLESINKELESFSYSVSHDLRAPLRAIDGYAGILEEDYGKILDEEGNRLLEAVQYNAKKMGNLIDDLLTFSRLGKKELSKTSLNMNELVEGALYELNKSLKHNATVKIKKLHPAKGDYGLINQVVINLLSNAIKYSSKVKLPLVEINSEKIDNEIIYCVKDNGAGFDMRYVNKLFGVFQRLHTMDEFEGTGVGLAIVQRIMAKHGGKVS